MNRENMHIRFLHLSGLFLLEHDKSMNGSLWLCVWYRLSVLLQPRLGFKQRGPFSVEAIGTKVVEHMDTDGIFAACRLISIDEASCLIGTPTRCNKFRLCSINVLSTLSISQAQPKILNSAQTHLTFNPELISNYTTLKDRLRDYISTPI